MLTGVAHTILSVSNFSVSKPFYQKLLTFLGLTLVFEGDATLYFVGCRTAVGIGQCPPEFKKTRFKQGSVGLHHVCFRARTKEDVDRLYVFLKREKMKVVHPPEEGPWAPGYYSVLFEDPDGIRLEVNHVPGKGVLAEGVTFNPADDYR